MDGEEAPEIEAAREPREPIGSSPTKLQQNQARLAHPPAPFCIANGKALYSD